jgi:hypothetical protein
MTEATEWFKPLLGPMVKTMVKSGAITGVAVEATPVWGLQDKLLISKVWGASNKREFIWTITGPSAVTDYVQGSLAATPQEAARHFALKWQMDADRLLGMAKAKSPIENSEVIVESHAKELIQHAESLYDLASQDEIWK